MWPKGLAPSAALVFEREGGADEISRRRECDSYAENEKVVDDDEAAGLHDLWLAITADEELTLDATTGAIAQG